MNPNPPILRDLLCTVGKTLGIGLVGAFFGWVLAVWLLGCAGTGEFTRDDDDNDAGDDDQADDDNDAGDDDTADDDTGDDDADPCDLVDGTYHGALDLVVQCNNYPQQQGACPLAVEIDGCDVVGTGTCPAPLDTTIEGFTGEIDPGTGDGAGWLQLQVGIADIVSTWPDAAVAGEAFTGSLPQVYNLGCYVSGSWLVFQDQE